GAARTLCGKRRQRVGLMGARSLLISLPNIDTNQRCAGRVGPRWVASLAEIEFYFWQKCSSGPSSDSARAPRALNYDLSPLIWPCRCAALKIASKTQRLEKEMNISIVDFSTQSGGAESQQKVFLLKENSSRPTQRDEGAITTPCVEFLPLPPEARMGSERYLPCFTHERLAGGKELATPGKVSANHWADINTEFLVKTIRFLITIESTARRHPESFDAAKRPAWNQEIEYCCGPTPPSDDLVVIHLRRTVSLGERRTTAMARPDRW
ncbi:hypothetical protein BaRGS_00025547, partial [Batillaria attramentaria]